MVVKVFQIWNERIILARTYTADCLSFWRWTSDFIVHFSGISSSTASENISMLLFLYPFMKTIFQVDLPLNVDFLSYNWRCHSLKHIEMFLIPMDLRWIHEQILPVQVTFHPLDSNVFFIQFEVDEKSLLRALHLNDIKCHCQHATEILRSFPFLLAIFSKSLQINLVCFCKSIFIVDALTQQNCREKFHVTKFYEHAPFCEVWLAMLI